MLEPVFPASVEVAANIFIPAEERDHWLAALHQDSRLARAVADMHTVLTEVAPGIFVQRCEVPDWIARMESDPVFVAAMDCLMDRLNQDSLSDTTVTLNFTPLGQRVMHTHSIASFALEYGKH